MDAPLLEEVRRLRAERDEARTIIRLARERLYDADGRTQHETYLVILAVGEILRRGFVPPASPAFDPLPTLTARATGEG